MPRRISEVWIHFHNESKGGKALFVCKYCSRSYKFPNATKMTRHLQKCINCPSEIIEVVNERDNNPPADSTTKKDLVISDEHNTWKPTVVYATSSTEKLDKPSTSNAKRPRNEITPSASPIDTEQNKIDRVLARAIYASDCPFSLVQNYYWKKAFHTLNSSYKPPSKNLLSSKFLEIEHEDIIKTIKTKIQESTHMTLLECGWSNTDSQNTISRVAITPFPVYLNTIEIKPDSYCTTEAEKIVSDHISELGSKKIFAFVADCALTMDASWEIISQRFPHITAIGCASNCLNVFLEYIFKLSSFEELTSECLKFLSFIKSNTALISVLKRKLRKIFEPVNISLLFLSSNFKPFDFAVAIQTLFRIKDTLQESIVLEFLNLKQSEFEVFLDNSIWAKIEKVVNFLKPISDSISKLESSKARVSEVLDAFYILRQELEVVIASMFMTEKEKNDVASKLTEREGSILRPIHAAAYLLDPRFRSSKALSEETEMCAITYITHLSDLLNVDSGQMLANLAQYRAAEGPWANKAVWKSSAFTDPSTWWKGLFSKQPLTVLAGLLLSIPPTVSMAEKCRNRVLYKSEPLNSSLDNEHLSKLVDVYSNLNLQLSTSTTTNETFNVEQIFVPDYDSD